MKKLYAILLISFTLHAQFNSLSDAVAYAQATSEYPVIDNDDWQKPDFTTFYDSQHMSGFSRLLGYIGLGSSVWSSQELERLLSEVITERERQGMRGDFVQKIIPGSEGEIVVLGDLQGAFHSFVRDLQELVRLRFLDNDLRITNGNYLVLNGNSIGSSAYNVETLLLILVLIKKNPERFIYIRGSNETVIQEQKSELFKQIRSKVGTKRHVLFKQVVTFFDTLPQALYVMKSSGEGLKISAVQEGIDDAMFADFLSNDVELPIMHVNQAVKSDKHISIDARVNASNFSRTLGLKRYVGPPVTWAVLSSPTGVNRRLHTFFNDAFAVIKIASRFNNWSITLYYQDVRKMDGFQVSGTYNLTTGSLVSGVPLNFFDTEDLKKLEQRIAQKKEAFQEASKLCEEQKGQKKKASLVVAQDGSTKRLILGSSLDLSRSMKEWGKKVKETLSKVFELQNEKGGLHGLEFQLIFLDDEYTPEQAAINYKKFVDEFHAEIMLVSLGTPTTQMSLDFVKADKFILLFPSTESSVFRKPDLKNVINLTRSYFDQGKALIDYILKKKKDVKKVALFYQDDAFGKDGLNGAKEALKKYDIDKIIELPYKRNQQLYAEQRKIIQKEDPDAIGFFSVPLAARELMRGLPIKFLMERVLFGVSDLGEAELQTYFKNKGITVIHSSAFPDIKRSDLPWVKEFRKFATQHNLTIGPFAFEAYAGAQLFLHLISQVDGPVTKENIIKAAEALKNVDYKGFQLNFDPETRTLLDALWISKGDGSDWLKIAVEPSQEEKVKKEEPKEELSKPESVKEDQKEETILQRDEEPSIAVQGDKIVLGNSGDYSKGLKAFAESLKLGTQLKLNDINRHGGIKGKSLQLVYLDDGYDQGQAKENIERLVNNTKTDLIFLTLGTPVFKSYFDLVKNGTVLALFPYTGSSTFRKPDLVNIIHYRPSYAQVLAEVTKFIVETHKAKKFVLFYQQGSVGDIPVQVITKLLRDDYNITDVLAVPHVANDMNFAVQAEQIKKFDGDTIAFIGPPVSAQGLIRQMGVEAFSDKILYGLSALEEKSFYNFANKKGLKFILPNILPDARNSKIELAQKFRKLAQANDIGIDQATFEAFVYMSLTGYLLDKVEGVLTKEKIIQVAEHMKDVDFDGLALNFNTKTRTLAKNIWINTGEDKPWIKKDIISLAELRGVEGVEKEKVTVKIDDDKIVLDASVLKSSNMVLQGDVLVVGNTSDFSKGLKELCLAIRSGMTLKANEINHKGGIKGNKLQIVYLDDGYNPEKAVKNIKLFLNEYKTDVILGSMGTPTLEAYLNLVQEGVITDFFPYSGAAAYRKPELRHLIHYRPSYNQEVALITKYMINEFSPKKVAIFYQDDSYGIPIKNTARDIFKEHGITEILEVSFIRNDLNFKEQAEEIKEFDPDVIGLMGTAISAQGLIRQMTVGQFTNKHLFGPSPIASEKMQKFLQAKGLSLVMSNVVPNPKTSMTQIAQEFREHAAKGNTLIDVNAFEGYLNVSLFAYLLEQIDEKVTTDKLIKAAENIKNVDFKGIKLNFNPRTRTLATSIWIDPGGDKPWIEKDIIPLVDDTTKDEPIEALEKTTSEVTDELAMAIHDDQIVIGCTLDLSRGLKAQSEAMQQGIDAKIEQFNAAGGINGKKIRMVYLDDGYDPQRAAKNVRKFLDDFKTDIILNPTGTPTLKGYIDLVKEKKIVVLFPLTGDKAFRQDDTRYVINYRPSFSQEMNLITQYVIDHEEIEKVALFYQQDVPSFVESVKKLMQKSNIEFTDVVYKRNDLSFKDQVKKIESYDPDAIALLSTSIAAKGIVRQLGVDFVGNKVLYGFSDLGEAGFQQFVQMKGIDVFVSNVLPNSAKSKLELAQEFRKVAEKDDIEVGPFSFEGYFNASLAIHLLTSIEGDITKAKIVNAAENIKDLNFKGIPLNYNSAARILASKIWVSQNAEKPWIETPIVVHQQPKIEHEGKEDKALPTKKIDAQPKKEAVLDEKDDSAGKKAVAIKSVSALKSSDMAVHDDTLVIGNTSDFSKGLKAMSDALKLGIDLKLKEVNAQGGINGKKIQMSYLDDGYIPKKARDNVDTFLNNVKTDILMASVGTPTQEAYIDLVEDGRITALFPFTGSSTFRKPELGHMVHYRPSYDQNIAEITQYIVNNFDPKKVALFYQDDTFGIMPKKAARQVLEKHGMSDVLEVPFMRNDLSFKEQAKTIENFDPDVIGFFGPSIAAQGLIRQMSTKLLANKRMYGLSWLTGETLQRFLKEKGLKMIIPNLVPNPKTSDMPIAKEFREAANKAGVPLDANAFEGYVNGALLTYLLKQIEGDVTTDKIIKAAENVKNVDFKGIKLNFDPQTRVLSQQSWIDFGTGDDWKHVEFAGAV